MELYAGHEKLSVMCQNNLLLLYYELQCSNCTNGKVSEDPLHLLSYITQQTKLTVPCVRRAKTVASSILKWYLKVTASSLPSIFTTTSNNTLIPQGRIYLFAFQKRASASLSCRNSEGFFYLCGVFLPQRMSKKLTNRTETNLYK